IFTLDGPTVILLTVGLTKNPRQLAAKARLRSTANEPIRFNFFAGMFCGTPWAAGSGAGGAILWLNCSREEISFELHFRAMTLDRYRDRTLAGGRPCTIFDIKPKPLKMWGQSLSASAQRKLR